MGKPYSRDLRERVVAAVEKGGNSRRKAAAHFGVGISTVINWVRRYGQDGWAQAASDRGRAPRLAAFQDQGKRLHLARACRGAWRARPQSRLQDGVEFRPRREAELQKKPCAQANRIARTSRAGVRNGKSIRPGSRLGAWSSSTRPGPRPIWRRSGDGRRGARGLKQKFRTASGKP
jgi:transposase